MEEYRRKIMDFFVEKGKADGLSLDSDLFEDGFVDSLFALEIVVYLEDTFRVKIKNRDITEENFRTIDNIAALVARVKG